ncbi:MAG: hypothetical protein WA678_01025 [Rhabdochlamydiaceae bacterium]
MRALILLPISLFSIGTWDVAIALKGLRNFTTRSLRSLESTEATEKEPGSSSDGCSLSSTLCRSRFEKFKPPMLDECR